MSILTPTKANLGPPPPPLWGGDLVNCDRVSVINHLLGGGCVAVCVAPAQKGPLNAVGNELPPAWWGGPSVCPIVVGGRWRWQGGAPGGVTPHLSVEAVEPQQLPLDPLQLGGAQPRGQHLAGGGGAPCYPPGCPPGPLPAPPAPPSYLPPSRGGPRGGRAGAEGQGEVEGGGGQVLGGVLQRQPPRSPVPQQRPRDPRHPPPAPTPPPPAPQRQQELEQVLGGKGGATKGVRDSAAGGAQRGPWGRGGSWRVPALSLGLRGSCQEGSQGCAGVPGCGGPGVGASAHEEGVPEGTGGVAGEARGSHGVSQGMARGVPWGSLELRRGSLGCTGVPEGPGGAVSQG